LLVKIRFFIQSKPEQIPTTRNTSISPGDHFGAFIEQQVSRGRYGSASDVVRAGLLKSLQQQ